MDVIITNTKTGNATFYTPRELLIRARQMARGRGRYCHHQLEIHGSSVCLVVMVEGRDGWRENIAESL